MTIPVNMVNDRRVIGSTLMILIAAASCADSPRAPLYSVQDLNLKKGEIVSCGPVDGELFGSVSFSASVPAEWRTDFNVAVALLHSFEYDEAEKMFAKIIEKAPACAMAYWGVAMSNFHPLWSPPNAGELEKGRKALVIARSVKNKTQRESDYIEAAARFFEGADRAGHRERVSRFESAMEEIYAKYPRDLEAAIFYSLALNAAADPADQTYQKQRKAFAMLNEIFQKNPLHPGIAHYIIHSYDNPRLAGLALPAARKYASIAPASPHAQHMPSHIFTRLGLWDECVESNLVSASSARCYAEKVNMKAHWDEELHALDYLVYAYLQNGNVAMARKQVEYLNEMDDVSPRNFKVAYAFAAIPARLALETRDWQMASRLRTPAMDFPWDDFPWQKALIHFARLLGHVHLGNPGQARLELDTLVSLETVLKGSPGKELEAAQVSVQVKAGQGWIEWTAGKGETAARLMRTAADMEDRMEKHPVTPGAILPARELLGDMLLTQKNYRGALEAYESDLELHPGRKNGLAGKKLAMEGLGLR